MDQIELTQFQQIVADMVLETPAPGKHAARSAIRHLEQAWAIRQVDPEMSAFRAITGEEESATALFHALRRRKYNGSRALNPRDHRQKAAVIPFLDAVASIFARFKQHLDLHPTLEVDTRAKRKKLKLRLTVGTSGRQKWVYPEPPLGFTATLNGAAENFAEEIAELISKHSAASILKGIEKRANHRNRLLYASQRGVPKIVGPVEPAILRRRDHVYRNLIIFLLVDQYPGQQLFAQEAVNSFLRMMRLVPRIHDA